MSGFEMIRRASRAIAFGRYMPLSKLARRASLTARRAMRDGFGSPATEPLPPPPLSESVPLPLFPPRRPGLTLADGVKQFDFLGHRVSMPGAVDWRAPGDGPKWQLWRMNLHYMEYLEQVDDTLFLDLISQWIDNNPAQQRGSWRDGWNAYALSLRCVVWMQQLAVRASRLPDTAVTAIHRSLAAQIRFLQDNLETDLGGNHLVKNLKTLIFASAYFNGAEALRWRRRGIELLRAAIDEQILADGVHYERSPSYHCQVFADLLECRQALGGDPLGGALDGALARMAQVCADLTHPDGRVALFNDAGLDMAYLPGECLDAYLALFGNCPSARNVFAFESAGYYGLRSGDKYLIIDCGRIAPDDLPGHGHGDILSFEWSVSGERVIVDQGVFEYIPGERRQRSRAAASHNTLCFAGADQADFFGAFRCGRRPNVTLLKFETNGDGFILEATHDGFQHLDGAPRHIRRFDAGPTEIAICDRIEGNPLIGACIRFLLEPKVEVHVTGREALIQRASSRIRMTSTLPIHIENAVWWPDMGHEEPTKRLCVSPAKNVREASMKFQIC
jgi:uncharacterized heparinase superfamily protein